MEIFAKNVLKPNVIRAKSLSTFLILKRLAMVAIRNMFNTEVSSVDHLKVNQVKT